MQLTKGIDFHRLFESAPGLYLILLPDLTIVAVSDAYLKATMTQREEIMGRGLFEVFPDNPDDPDATGVSNLRTSLEYVLKHAVPHTMAVQQYDIRRPDGTFEERFWSPLNKPVFNDKNKIAYIIHRVEDVTEFMRMKKEEAQRERITEELRGKVQKMEMEIYNRAREVQEINTRLINEIKEKQKAEETIEASRKMFSTLFYQSPVMNYMADAVTGRYIDVNDNFAEFCGLPKEDIIGKNSLELNLIVNTEKRQEIINTLKQNGYARDILTEITPRNGEKRWVSTSAHVVNINGKECFLTAMIDVSERKNAEEELKKSNELFAGLFELNPASLSISRLKDGKLLAVNSSFLRIFGFISKEEVVGKTAQEINILFDSEKRNELYRRLKEWNKVLNAEGMITTALGETKWLSISMLMIEVDNEPCTLTVSIDITARKTAEEQVELVNKELEAFSYSVSHDLRSPLRIIDGYSELMISDYSNSLDPEGNRLLGIIKANVRKMGRLIDDLLNFSRLGRKELTYQQVDMNKMAETVIAELLFSGTKKYNIEISALEPAVCDSSLIRQVWVNLISNALKYSGDKENPAIEISSAKSGNEIVYSVKDNGVGFNMQYAHKLFGVFQRLHKMTEFEGTGVGLALVQRIITRHGGRVWAEAEVNKGAAFYFSLPQQLANNQKN
ncbi:MAG: PAS domain S-box protein [Chitinophagaceae bacterium]